MSNKAKRKLSELQRRVFDLLDAKPDTDIPVSTLYLAAYDKPQNDLFPPTNRDMQQKMGPLFSRLNAKLSRGRIEPGVTKQTYRLTIFRKE